MIIVPRNRILWQLAAMSGYSNLFLAGDCESTDGWSSYRSIGSLDNVNEYEGSNCIKLTMSPEQTTGFYSQNITSLLSAKHYLISAYVKNGNLNTGINIKFDTNDNDRESSVSAGTTYTRIGVLIEPSDFDTATTISLYVKIFGTENQYGYIDAIMINEISAADYVAGLAACLAKYPYKSPS